jgi:RNA polymerase sigma factor (sigma-70 family)
MEVSALRQTGMPGLPGSAPLLRLQSDERLIALIRRGHHAAFEALVSRYETRLLSFCRHMLSSREDAEDVLQEVFAAAFNAILADEREINARPWLYRIARNRCLNHMRRATPVGMDSMDIYYAEHGQSTSEKILGRERFHQLIGDVQQLPESQRSALLLREIDALSYEQIAETMETTVPSVKSLLVRARISLAEAAEARQLSCSEVRLALGEAAEGLLKVSPPARRHVRNCERCRAFRKHLKDNNHALAAVLPVAPLLMLKKLLLTKLGSTAGAGHVAGASAGSAVVGAGTAASAGSGVGGLASLGAGALATKAVAGLAAAALVTAGAVEADHASSSHPHGHRSAQRTLAASVPDSHQLPMVVRSDPQPLSASVKVTVHKPSAHHHAGGSPVKPKPPVPALPASVTPTPTSAAVTVTPASAVKPPPKPPLTEVQTAKTELPPPSSSTTTTTTTQTTTQPTSPPPAQTQTNTTSTEATPPANTSSTGSEPTTTAPTETPPSSSSSPTDATTTGDTAETSTTIPGTAASPGA